MAGLCLGSAQDKGMPFHKYDDCCLLSLTPLQARGIFFIPFHHRPPRPPRLLPLSVPHRAFREYTVPPPAWFIFPHFLHETALLLLNTPTLYGFSNHALLRYPCYPVRCCHLRGWPRDCYQRRCRRTDPACLGSFHRSVSDSFSNFTGVL